MKQFNMFSEMQRWNLQSPRYLIQKFNCAIAIFFQTALYVHILV